MKKFLIVAAVVWLGMTACREEVKDAVQVDAWPPIFPDYTEVTIPVGIAPLNFNSADESECLDVVLKGSDGEELHVQGDYAAFDADKWRRLVEENQGGELVCSVCIKSNGRWKRYKDFRIYVSAYELEDYGLTYRKIAPGYEVYSKMGLYERELSSFEERALLENTEVPGMCVNCHTPNRTNPEQFVFHVRGAHGGTLVQRAEETELLQAVNDSLKGSMVYPYWHPSGRYCAFSTNQTRQGFHVVKDERVEVFDLSSDVFVYDAVKHKLLLDSLLCQKNYSENAPVFSPDGRTLYYMTALQRHYPTEFREQKYSLCSIGFDAESGTFGQQVDTLFDATKEGKSLTWPRPSYDGKYIMVTLADYGYFSIWHKESDLWLIDVKTGQMTPVVAANSDDADSFHNWSAGSHWFVFTSRRENGLYSLLYLSCIDDNGQATKPFLLPQENPKAYYGQSVFSYNTPDFTSSPVKLDAKKAAAAIESPERVSTTVR